MCTIPSYKYCTSTVQYCTYCTVIRIVDNQKKLEMGSVIVDNDGFHPSLSTMTEKKRQPQNNQVGNEKLLEIRMNLSVQNFFSFKHLFLLFLTKCLWIRTNLSVENFFSFTHLLLLFLTTYLNITHCNSFVRKAQLNLHHTNAKNRHESQHCLTLCWKNRL